MGNTARTPALTSARDESTTAAATRMRVLVTAFFALDGFIFANWVVRVPEIKTHVGASPGELGLALLSVSAGAVATMTITGRLCARFGSRRLAVITGLLLASSVILPPQMLSVATLSAALLVFGIGFGGLNVAINSAAVDITRQLARPIMPTFHAAYSLGGLTGAVAGGAAAAVLSPAWHLALVGIFGIVACAVAGVMLLRCPLLPVEQQPADGRSRTERPGQADHPVRSVRLLVYVFGLIALCSAYGEGALADWSALHLRTDLHTSATIAASGYAIFSVAMVMGRLTGSWMITRLGRTTVLAAGGLCAAAGMTVAALAPALPLVLVGFVLVGLGLANQFPAAIGQAGVLNGPAGVASASTLGLAGMLIGPPTIGFLADRAGLPVALLSIAVLAVAAAVIAVLAHNAET